MGKGKARRRRALNVQKSKIQGTRIPAAPPPQKKLHDALPGSFKKMLLLQEVAAKKNEKKPRVEKAEAVSSTGASKGRENMEGDKQNSASTSGKNAADPAGSKADHGNGEQNGKDLNGKKLSMKRKIIDGPLFTKQVTDNKLRRRQYLKDKKKKKKGHGKEGDGDVDDRPQFDRTQPRFGEQAMQPIKVNLKRKHWDNGAKEESESRSSGRLSEVFRRQMEQAAARAGPAVEVRAAQGGRRDDVIQARPKTKRAPVDDATRLQAIDAYRLGKKSKKSAGASQGRAELGPASLSSLAELVQKDA